FSSRRRHTRWPRDWSSDVCSSDLKFQEVQSAFEVLSDADKRKRYDQFGSDFDPAGGAGGHPGGWRYTTSSGPQTYPFDVNDLNRSEERRVGKECRSSMLMEHKENK